MAPRGTFRRIAEELRELILSGELEPGAFVPSELTLVERHGVARGTVRSALAVLASEGLVEVVPGQGRRVLGGAVEGCRPAAYIRIADDMTRRVRAGELARDSMLPSESALIEEYGVSRSTVRRAYRVLAERGLVVVRQGAGAFLAPP